jgi:hypothetical protein
VIDVSRRNLALAKALTQIILTCLPCEKSFVAIVLPQESSFTKVYLVKESSVVSKFLLDNIGVFQKPLGVQVFLYSVILSRGIEVVQGDRDDVSLPLVQRFGHSSQDLVNLLLTGRAVSNVHDGDKFLGDVDAAQALESEGGSVSFSLKGILHEVPIGFLSSLEALRYSKVGDFYKNPEFPIWVVGSASHYTVLFGLNKKITFVDDSKKEEQKAREIFNQFDAFENGFVPVDQANDLLDRLNVGARDRATIRSKLDPEEMGIILWTNLWNALQARTVSHAEEKSWTCAACTFINEGGSSCSICTTVRPPPPSKPILPKVEELKEFSLYHFNGISNSKSQVDQPRCCQVLVTLSDISSYGFGDLLQDAGLREVIQTRWPSCIVEFAELPEPKIS